MESVSQCTGEITPLAEKANGIAGVGRCGVMNWIVAQRIVDVELGEETREDLNDLQVTTFGCFVNRCGLFAVHGVRISLGS